MLTKVAQHKPFNISILAALFLLFTIQPAQAEPHAEEEDFDAAEMILHHIQDAHEIHLWGHTGIPMPMILVSADDGVSVFMSSKFDHGTAAYKGYFLDHGKVKRLSDTDFSGAINAAETDSTQYTTVNWAGFFGGDEGAFINVSITKNVATLFFTSLVLILLFGAAARHYKGG